MTAPVATWLLDAAQTLSATAYGQLPVTDPDGCYLGVATARGVADALADGEHDRATLASVIETPAWVRAGQSPAPAATNNA